MKVLVTGGAGFIGSHVVDGLLAREASVVVLDNLSTGVRENLPKHKHLQFIKGDVRDTSEIDALVAGVQVVVHLAAIASVPASIDDPRGTHETNFIGTLNLLEAARRCGVRRFIYASSAAVYGDGHSLPLNEEITPKPLSPYAADKLASEQYLRFYCHQHRLPAIAFRFFNIFGPRQNPASPYSGVISIFVDRVLRRAPVTIYGDGEQTRDFVFVGDLSDLLVETALSQRSLHGESINVGRGSECSLLRLLGTIEEVTGQAVSRNFSALRPGDIRRSCADIARLRAFAPEHVPMTSLADGLRRLVEYLEPS